MNISISTKTSRDKSKPGITWNGQGQGPRKSACIYTFAKPKDFIQKNYNKEALTILETKRSDDSGWPSNNQQLHT